MLLEVGAVRGRLIFGEAAVGRKARGTFGQPRDNGAKSGETQIRRAQNKRGYV
jgi:hypothetical protein